MKDNQFDRFIREHMEGLSPEYREEHWEELEQRLDGEEAGMPPVLPDRALDETAFNKLHQLHVPYREANWQKLSSRLDDEFIRPLDIVRYKVLELACLLLIILTLWQWQSSAPAPAGPVAGRTETPSVPDRFTPSPSAGSAFETPDSPPATASPVDTPAPESASVPAQTSRTPAFPPATAPNQKPRRLLLLPALPNRTTEENRHPVSSLAENSAPFPPVSAPLPSGHDFELLAADDIPTPRRSRFGNNDIMSPLSFKPASGLFYPPGRDLGSTALQKSPRQAFFNFAMFGSLDYNRIVSPSNYFFGTKLSEFDRFELGYSGGFTLGYEFGRWEIQSGLIYSSKHYEPLQLLIKRGNFQDGYTEEQLKDIQLNIINLPLNLRYNFLQRDRWRLYALGGASVQVATQANYFVDSGGNRRSSVLYRYLKDGWLEGGSFAANSFVTANLGLGIERFISTRWSIFAQPTYQHAIGLFNEQGLGPTKDRISVMSFYSGIRVRMYK